ncbi:hypothetical protein LZ31DRAFT_636730 [Colletotrichum somersetense]|nr:hypothetical protein LZ31DRAFT_636730 [Colletotrichum somersetense]
MAATASAPPALETGQATLDHDDSNISSPLSDVEDKDGEGDSLDGMQLDRPQEDPDEALDSDSNLSEANDTEAETERLFDTPQAQRHKDVVVNQFNDGQVFDRTPSKLQKTFSVDATDDGDDESLSDRDDVSMISSHADEASPSKPKKPNTLPSTEDDTENIDTKKRKRSPVAESSEPGQPARKRTGSVVPHDQDQHKNVVEVQEDEVPSTASHTDDHSATDDNAPELPPIKRGPLRDGHSPVKDLQITKKITRNGSRRKGHVPETNEHEGLDGDGRDGRNDEDSGPHADDHPEQEGDEDAEASKNDEEVERKRAAVEEWTDLEEKFVVFRERLYKDRLERLEQEEQSLQAEPPSHPEYLNMKQCLDERLEKKLRNIEKEYELSVEALERLAVARRAQIWNQFYQGARESRSKMLEHLNKEWYETQNARRSAHSVPDYGLLFPTNPTQRTRNAVAYNSEVSFLAGLAKHEGFPAVPPMRGANGSEIEDDLEAMKRNSKPRQRSIMQPIEDYQAVAFGGNLGPAGEQFIKDTPWANPNHIAHKITTGPVVPAVGAKPQATQANKTVAGPSHARPMQTIANGHAAAHVSPQMNRFTSASPEMVRTANVLTQSSQMKRAGSRTSKAAKDTAPKQEPVSAMAS